jgi:hypothetical protein
VIKRIFKTSTQETTGGLMKAQEVRSKSALDTWRHVQCVRFPVFDEWEVSLVCSNA